MTSKLVVNDSLRSIGESQCRKPFLEASDVDQLPIRKFEDEIGRLWRAHHHMEMVWIAKRLLLETVNANHTEQFRTECIVDERPCTRLVSRQYRFQDLYAKNLIKITGALWNMPTTMSNKDESLIKWHQVKVALSWRHTVTSVLMKKRDHFVISFSFYRCWYHTMIS